LRWKFSPVNRGLVLPQSSSAKSATVRICPVSRPWAADDAVAQLRTEAGRDPYDRALSDLVGELSTRSPAFRTRWAAHDVRLHQTGTKHVRHPVVGELHLDYEAMELPGQPGLLLIAFTTPAGSPDEDAIRLLASWAATHAPDRQPDPAKHRE
jgi:hypothetical protein